MTAGALSTTDRGAVGGVAGCHGHDPSSLILHFAAAADITDPHIGNRCTLGGG
jgi:hypothetical protein